MAVTILQDPAKQCGLKPASGLDPLVEPRTSPLPFSAPIAPDFVVIDVETACHRASSICQIGIVGFAGGREVFAYETLVDPQDAFSPFNIRLHGIGPQHVAGQPHFSRLYGTLLQHLGGRITVAHSNFDHGALSAACRTAGLPMIRSRWLDSVKVARHAWPDLPTHRLNALAGHLGLEHKHHDALSDARWVVVRAMESFCRFNPTITQGRSPARQRFLLSARAEPVAAPGAAPGTTPDPPPARERHSRPQASAAPALPRTRAEPRGGRPRPPDPQITFNF